MMIFEFKKHHVATVVMILCFIYGGASLLFFFVQIGGLVNSPPRNTTLDERFTTNTTSFNESNNDINGIIYSPFRIPPQLENRARPFFYFLITISLFGSIISIFAGISLLMLLRKDERKRLTKSIINTMMTPEEKMIVGELERKGGELTQSELVRTTGLSKVKIHRVIKRLEEMKVIAKYPYGMTNKIKLET